MSKALFIGTFLAIGFFAAALMGGCLLLLSRSFGYSANHWADTAKSLDTYSDRATDQSSDLAQCVSAHPDELKTTPFACYDDAIAKTPDYSGLRNDIRE